MIRQMEIRWILPIDPGQIKGEVPIRFHRGNFAQSPSKDRISYQRALQFREGSLTTPCDYSVAFSYRTHYALFFDLVKRQHAFFLVQVAHFRFNTISSPNRFAHLSG